MATVSSLTLRLSSAAARAAGSPAMLGLAVVVATAAVVYGASTDFSQRWTLTFDIVTSLVPLLMVFILQSSQNRDGIALQAKLDELILRSEGANRLVGAEHLDEQELHDLAHSIRHEAREGEPPDAGEASSPLASGRTATESLPTTS